MDKQKQIEEIANELCWLREDEYREIANLLYEVGYRKIPENAVVLTEEEYKRLQRRQECCKTCEEIASEMVKKARKETAEKFAKRLKARLNIPIDYLDEKDIDEICKEITEGKV